MYLKCLPVRIIYAIPLHPQINIISYCYINHFIHDRGPLIFSIP